MRRCLSGFSLVETLVALVLVSLAAMLVVRSSAANAVALTQVIRKSVAFRMTSEFSAWTQRNGQLALGMSIDDALAEVHDHAISCDMGDCDAHQAAWHYLSQWRERLSVELPDARMVVCVDDFPAPPVSGWSCHSNGSMWVMKLGWPPRSDAEPSVVVALHSA